MNIVFLDSYTLNPGDLDWSPLQQLGQVHFYERTRPQEVVSRAKDATIVILNKTPMTKEILEQLNHLQCICVAATGYNTIDIEAAKARNLVVCNAVGYSSPSVAQHVFALLLEITNRVGLHSLGVAKDKWAKAKDWSYWDCPIKELAGQVMGIYGLGKIGQKVAQLALAFEMEVITVHKYPKRDAMPGVQFVDQAVFFSRSDIISLHVPLTQSTKHLINSSTIASMKPSTILINTGRGDLVDEQALREALLNGSLAAAGLDVLSEEPPAADHPLIGLENCIITPHQAWASKASRQRLLDTVIKNIQAFQAGRPINRVI